MIVRDNISVCRYYSKRIDLANHFGELTNDSESIQQSDATSHNISKSRPASKSRKLDTRGNSKTKKATDDMVRSSIIHEEEQNSLIDDDKNSELSIGQY